MVTKKRTARTADALRRDYDLSTLAGGVRGKYHERARAGNNLVLLEPEIARVFPNSKAVNEALGLLLRAAGAGAPRADAHERSKASRVTRAPSKQRRTS
jgi:hypothetical protein